MNNSNNNNINEKWEMTISLPLNPVDAPGNAMGPENYLSLSFPKHSP